jgi:hypothetical protein
MVVRGDGNSPTYTSHGTRRADRHEDLYMTQVQHSVQNLKLEMEPKVCKQKRIKKKECKGIILISKNEGLHLTCNS